MLLGQARSTYWRKWAAKHDNVELKEGTWLEPGLGSAAKGDTDKHRNAARKLVLEGGWIQKRVFDIGWSNESKCQACHTEGGTEKHRLPPEPRMERGQT